jgi:hypothetical protein
LGTKELAVDFLFHHRIFGQKQHDCHPPSTLPQLKITLKSHHFDATEAIEADSQVELNTLIEHDFQGAFKKQQKCW